MIEGNERIKVRYDAAFIVYERSAAGSRAAVLKRVAIINAICLAAMVVVALRYFFIIPLGFLAVSFLPFTIVAFAIRAEMR